MKCAYRVPPPPFRWPEDIDEIAVAHLVDGRRVKTTPNERTKAIAILTARRLTAAAIAVRINCTTRTVERHRQKLAAA